MKKVVDLSEHNGIFDFNILKENGIEGVILRLGWIGNKNNHTIDKRLQDYVNQAKRVGLKIGFYIYSYCRSLDALKSGIEWADTILENIGLTTSIFLDLEDSQIDDLSKEELTKQAEYFCNYYKLKGYNSGVYANKYWFNNKLNVNKLLDYKIWLAEWGVDQPTVSYKVDIWQYTSDLYINNKRFDGNYCYCDDCSNNDNDNKGGFEVKDYINGSTTEYVYQDAQGTKQIGYLHPHEKAKCYGIVNNMALVVYTIDGTNNQKSGFCKWLGGIQ